MFIVKHAYSEKEYHVATFATYRVVKNSPHDISVFGRYEDGRECEYSLAFPDVLYVANQHGETVDVIRPKAKVVA